MVEGGDSMRQASSYKPKLNFHFLDHVQDPNEIDTVFSPHAHLQPAGPWYSRSCFGYCMTHHMLW